MTSLDATILVVDDHVPNLAFLTDALSADGYRVLVALDGQEALDRLAVARPDLILLDALMPVLDGFETCRRLKAAPAYEAIPVIFMTALGEPEQIVQGLSLGAVDYVTKPAHPQVVKARIAAHLGASRSLALAREALVQSGQLPIAVDTGGNLVGATTDARAWLNAYGIGERDLAHWLAVLSRPGASRAPLMRRLGDRALYVNLLGRSGKNVFLLMREEDPKCAQRVLARDFALSGREAEVLVWVAYGKTNMDIADILGMSPRTVNKHLEHIFLKMGVETRSAATALALRRPLGASATADEPLEALGETSAPPASCLDPHPGSASE